MIGTALLLLVRNMSFYGEIVPTYRVCAGLIVHSPCTLDSRIKGTYQSTLPDGQKEILEWDDGQKKTQYYDGTVAGKCDTILSANNILVSSGSYIDWDFHDLSEADNDIGHGLAQDNLGLEQCNSRIYSILIKNLEISSGHLQIGNAAVDRWNGFLESGSILKLPPNSFFVLACENAPVGIAVGAGNSNLKLNAIDGDVRLAINYNACSV